jgi:hypothetical protein
MEKGLWAGTVSLGLPADAIRDLRGQLKNNRLSKPLAGLILTRPTRGYELDLPAHEIRMISD